MPTRREFIALTTAALAGPGLTMGGCQGSLSVDSDTGREQYGWCIQCGRAR